jgi:hypothetical protein
MAVLVLGASFVECNDIVVAFNLALGATLVPMVAGDGVVQMSLEMCGPLNFVDIALQKVVNANQELRS